MREVILIKNGEIVLKGLNRPKFEAMLIRNIRRRLRGAGLCRIERAQSAIYIEPLAEDFDFKGAVERLQKVFGIASFSKSLVTEKELGAIEAAAAEYLKDDLARVQTFKVESKRADKRFPLASPQLSAEVGGYLLDKFPHLKVDVHDPELTVMVEIRDYGAYIHAGSIAGAGGMPVGSNGRAALLISGGIDSPVAGYMLAKRGVELCAVHFASPPYTSERAREKVISLLELVAQYSGRITCYIVPFTKIQQQILESCPEELYTVIMRRMMMKIACRIAGKEGCPTLVTGESIGQVASQTMEAICCTDNASAIPVFRPLIGMDKEEIITVARRIGTFETSILPYEDCCTLFTPKHPRTKPKLKYVEEAEAEFDFLPLLDEAFDGAEKITVN
ncbi:MAG: tRNA 4-thiouridine(8) synthase ThiI [Clostridia bacterium]|nr:tRNA 4-thiouridine(8) synthase ThiI [Clostridia bacterium]